MSSASGSELLARTAQLVAIPSVSHQETALADHVEATLANARGLEVRRIGDNVVARTSLGRPARLVLAGHLDTVPPNSNAEPRLEGDTLWGLGSADMKGGLAVLLGLALRIGGGDAADGGGADGGGHGQGAGDPLHDVTFVFYVCEEVARAHSGLLEIERADPELLRGDAAILGEPTGALVEAGCQGSMRVLVSVRGRRAHTARPWAGVNAVHRLAPVLRLLSAYESRQPEIGGCRYRESVQAVRVDGGIAGNVVPDEARVAVNLRFAPDRGPEEAFEHLSRWLWSALDPDLDAIDLEDSSPAAPPGLDHPILASLVTASGMPPRAKLGWTDVAFFAERGVPAANFGPGDPEVAHTAGEHVTRRDVEKVNGVLSSLLLG